MGLWRIWHPTYGVIYDEGESDQTGHVSPQARHGPAPEYDAMCNFSHKELTGHNALM